MKTINLDGQNITIFRERGEGDGGMALMYIVDMLDGTYVGKRVWWSDPATAEDVYDNASTEYVRWAKDDALRRQDPIPQRTPEEPQPDPTPTVRV